MQLQALRKLFFHTISVTVKIEKDPLFLSRNSFSENLFSGVKIQSQGCWLSVLWMTPPSGI